jgi:hypothetical protein
MAVVLDIDEGLMNVAASLELGTFSPWTLSVSVAHSHLSRVSVFVHCSCTAFIIKITVAVADRPKTCTLVYGVYDVAEFKRSFVRADIARLYDITGLLK